MDQRQSSSLMGIRKGTNSMIILIDIIYSLIEKYAGKFSVCAWQKRWANRERGTGYRASEYRAKNKRDKRTYRSF